MPDRAADNLSSPGLAAVTSQTFINSNSLAGGDSARKMQSNNSQSAAPPATKPISYAAAAAAKREAEKPPVTEPKAVPKPAAGSQTVATETVETGPKRSGVSKVVSEAKLSDLPPHLIHELALGVGAQVQISTVDGKTYENGLLDSFNATGDVIIRSPQEIHDNRVRSSPDYLGLERRGIVSMTVKDVRTSPGNDRQQIRAHDGVDSYIPTDADLAKKLAKAAKPKERELVAWESEEPEVHHTLDGDHKGWSFEDMLARNQKLATKKSDYDPNMKQYTVALPQATDELARKAEMIAAEIESKENFGTSKKFAELENLEDEEDQFSAVKTRRQSQDVRNKAGRYEDSRRAGGNRNAPPTVMEQNWRQREPEKPNDQRRDQRNPPSNPVPAPAVHSQSSSPANSQNQWRGSPSQASSTTSQSPPVHPTPVTPAPQPVNQISRQEKQDARMGADKPAPIKVDKTRDIPVASMRSPDPVALSSGQMPHGPVHAPRVQVPPRSALGDTGANQRQAGGNARVSPRPQQQQQQQQQQQHQQPQMNASHGPQGGPPRRSPVRDMERNSNPNAANRPPQQQRQTQASPAPSEGHEQKKVNVQFNPMAQEFVPGAFSARADKPAESPIPQPNVVLSNMQQPYPMMPMQGMQGIPNVMSEAAYAYAQQIPYQNAMVMQQMMQQGQQMAQQGFQGQGVPQMNPGMVSPAQYQNMTVSRPQFVPQMMHQSPPQQMMGYNTPMQYQPMLYQAAVPPGGPYQPPAGPTGFLNMQPGGVPYTMAPNGMPMYYMTAPQGPLMPPQGQGPVPGGIRSPHHPA